MSKQQKQAAALGGKARAKKLTRARRKEIASKAAAARWGTPSARSCGIVRTMEITVGITIDMRTGATDYSAATKQTVTAECGVPLFGAVERSSGVCRACASGWEVTGNTFASEAERDRARGEAVHK